MLKMVYLVGGCLWGVQAFIKTLDGEYDGFAECVKIEFDPKLVSVSELMNYFFEIIDPYSLNKQG